MQQIPAPTMSKSDDEWRQQLSSEEYHVLREAGTERAGTGEYVDTKTTGVYRCRACGSELFRSDAKFDSHCGWPSFYEPTEKDNVVLVPNRAIKRQGRDGNVVVDVLVGSKAEPRQIKTGLASDQMTEVVEGLQEGDQVMLPATTTVAPRVGALAGPPGAGPAVAKPSIQPVAKP